MGHAPDLPMPLPDLAGLVRSAAPGAWRASLLALAWISLSGLVLLLLRLEFTFGAAPRLGPPAAAEGAAPGGSAVQPPQQPGVGAMLRLVIPAYNEAANIAACLTAAMASHSPGVPWELVVVDDGSDDATSELAAGVLAQADPEAGRSERLLAAGPRPAGERWCGKNWPASRAAALAWPPGDPADQWLLFIDADVRLGPWALAAALAEARRSGADLLSLAPRLQCGCLAEWLVQPIVATLLGLGFPMARSNDPNDPTAFAAGPFMLFRRSAYEAIGGHGAIPDAVVEDLTLARRIKASGHRLRYLLGVDLLDLRMYRDWPSLWEGWTKNWFLGVDRDLIRALGSMAVVLQLFSVPWLLLALAPWAGGWGLAGPALIAITLQLLLRLWSRWRFGVPLRFWWLAGVGGPVIGAIVPASIWKTLTGRGWTWRGRSLAEGGTAIADPGA